MKKNYKVLVGLAAFLVIIALSCDKKKSDGIAPGYKADTGTGGNPNANNPTVTGSTTNTNLATQNSNLLVGGSGWSNPSCGTTNSLVLKGLNGTTEVSLMFATPPTNGTFVVSSLPSPTACAMMITNAPNQPAGIVWYARSGQVVVNTSANSINGTFSNIQFVQSNFNYPVVTASGTLGCSQ